MRFTSALLAAGAVLASQMDVPTGGLRVDDNTELMNGPGTRVRGTTRHAASGEIHSVSVHLESQLRAHQALRYLLTPQRKLITHRELWGNESQAAFEAAMAVHGRASIDIASTLAQAHLGNHADIVGHGAQIDEIAVDRPGGRAGLVAGEVIVAVDGAPVTTAAQARDLLGASGPGPVTLTVTAVDAPAGAGTVRDVEITVPGPSGSRRAPTGPGFVPGGTGPLGLVLSTHQLSCRSDVSVTFPGGAAMFGASAGVAIFLAVVDVCSDIDMLGGARIAATGAVTPDGRVDPVVGVDFKAWLAARSGMAAMIVPAASELPADPPLPLLAVGTVEEALDAARSVAG